MITGLGTARLPRPVAAAAIATVSFSACLCLVALRGIIIAGTAAAGIGSSGRLAAFRLLPVFLFELLVLAVRLAGTVFSLAGLAPVLLVTAVLLVALVLLTLVVRTFGLLSMFAVTAPVL